MIKLVMFDWNGTILADVAPLVKSVNYLLSKIDGKSINLKEHRELSVVPIADFFEKLGYRRETVIKDASFHAEIFHPYYERLVAKGRTRAGVKETLIFLKKRGIRTAIFSNHLMDKISFQLKRLKLEEYFDDIVANTKITTSVHTKNKVENVKRYIKLKKIKSQEAIIVGDTPEEAEIGKTLGIKSILLTDGHSSLARLKASSPDYIISNFKKLIPIVRHS